MSELIDLPTGEILSGERLAALEARIEADLRRRRDENALAHYIPYDRQRDFHDAGARYRERLLMAGNQVGKTLAAAMETAMHVTGLYPDWWKGYRFDRPIQAWACGETNEVVRGSMQKLLLGDPTGTGCIPKHTLLEVVVARGLGELADMIKVQHVSGEVSVISLKSYAAGRERFQGATIDFAWLDEEPDESIFFEVLARTTVTAGPMIMTFTPLKGMSSVVKRYINETSPDRHVTKMTVDDAAHITADMKKQFIAQYPDYLRDVRLYGVPMVGEGRVFTVSEEILLVDPFERPKHWIRLGGLDFGWTHFAAFCEMWWDRDLDIVYLVRTLRLREQTPHQHVEAVRHWGLKWAWPHDGRNQTLAGAGVPLMRQYEAAGLDMMHDHAQFEDGGNSVEAGVQMMADRMRGGRWKVFRDQNAGWLEEYRMYHRKDGLLVKIDDDALSASRYAMMALRYGQTTIPPKPRSCRAHAGSSWMAA
jgi:phage terminase large subunit-like protein